MVRRIARAYDNAVIATCPKCETCWKFFRTPNPQIDSCGFESYSFQCKRCKSSLAGIIDPMDDELLISLLEPTSWLQHSTQERVDSQTEEKQHRQEIVETAGTVLGYQGVDPP